MTGSLEIGMREPPAQRRVGHGRDTARVSDLGFEHDQWRASHALDTAGDEHLALAAPDGLRRGVDGLQAGATQAVDRLAWYVDGQAGEQERHPGDIAVVLAGLVGAPQNNV